MIWLIQLFKCSIASSISTHTIESIADAYAKWSLFSCFSLYMYALVFILCFLSFFIFQNLHSLILIIVGIC